MVAANRSKDARRGVVTGGAGFIGSGTLYGDVDAAELPIDESTPHRPRSPYGLAKKTVIDYLALYSDLFGLGYTALALANVYGPRQDPRGEAGVVAIFANQLRSGAPCRIEGDGEQTRDFVFVDGAARAFELAADKASMRVVNIGTGVHVSINQLHAALAAAMDSPIDF